MKQIIQNYKNGKLELADVPRPALKNNCLLVRNAFSVLSGGTEKTMLELAKKSILNKALARPDLTRQVILKARTDGIFEALKAAFARLDTPVALGYSSAGIVVDSAGVEGIKKGDRVACAGSGFASHAEEIVVPRALCVKIPDNVDLESASFIGIGGIVMEAIRLANLNKTDKVAVIGLGLLGQITVQALKALGVQVAAIDINDEKVSLALKNGADAGMIGLPGRTLGEFAPAGADAVIIMAADKTNQPIELAAQICRERARIVACGLVGLDIPRRLFFDKELELVVSKAWGPQDCVSACPSVAQTNFTDFLSCLSTGAIKLSGLITHRFEISRALQAYDLLLKGKEPYIGVLIKYPDQPGRECLPSGADTRERKEESKSSLRDQPMIGVIGAGLYASQTLLPIVKTFKNVKLKTVATAGGASARHAARKFGFARFTTDYQEVIRDPGISLVMIMTRHDSHGPFTVEAISAGKHVFVEKPLCINDNQLDAVIEASAAHARKILMVGFNRRFSPFATWLKEKFRFINEPLSVHCTVNAGFIPAQSWLHNPREGGGRLIGEASHFIDLAQYFCGSYAVKVFTQKLDSCRYQQTDNFSVSIKFANGSIASIIYLASGDKIYPRERIEIFGGGSVGVIDNFRKAEYIFQGKKESLSNFISIDRGHKKEMELLFKAVASGGAAPVPREDYFHVMRTVFAAQRSLEQGCPIEIGEQNK
ncbi:MAG: bi-domain-containing oxidoreductase [Candidatus Omnitrophica bacterium]|nr:bi-domain-containing oxidoreductase [Candidatus Omnitrophota bacterium]